MQQATNTLHGAGLGLRREFFTELQQYDTPPVDFLEVAPENWIGIGGKNGDQFRWFSERYNFVCHGLSLSLGGPGALDLNLVRDIKDFLNQHTIPLYSEHLSYCSDHGQLYDLLPIPFSEEAVHHVAGRIRQVQDILERRIAVENVSYYTPAAGQQMSEAEFLRAVLEEADCDLLLDVNNIYVNSVNHHYDAEQFLATIPAERTAYIHVAGHYNEADDLLIDTHGADVIDPVWRLLSQAYEHCGVVPTLLERDFNIPPLAELMDEVDAIRTLQHQHAQSDWEQANEPRVAFG